MSPDRHLQTGQGGGGQEGRPLYTAAPFPLLPCPLMTIPKSLTLHLTVTLPLLEIILWLSLLPG